ncbi:MAG: putative oxidoreductase [Verrucomicrobiae bacterium]|nr:putative oxidoreductase [Verrucomicrobiae bacterium]
MKGKVVIITGASSGIGKETARALAHAGATVVIAARRAEPLRQLAATHPGLVPIPADVTDDTAVTRLIETTVEKFGRLDILINNAGLGMRALVEKTKPEDARQVMDINFFGVLRCTQAALPIMRRQGAGQIVNIASVLAVIATPRNSIYCASKFALLAFSDALRLEVRSAGIDVITILPGYTDTPFFDNLVRYDGSARMSPFAGQRPEHVAQVILRACRRRRRQVSLTFLGILGGWAKRLVPGFVDWSLRRSV